MKNTSQNLSGLTFKYKKFDGKFIHTLCDGELLYRFGLIPDQVIGKDLVDFLPDEAADEMRIFYQKAWDGEENVIYEAQTNDIYYLVSLYPIKKGRAVIEVIGSCIDITKQRETEKALRESKHIYQLIAENRNELSSIIDLNGKLLYVSPSHELILGHSISYFKDKYYISEIHPEDKAMYSVLFEETVKSKQSCQLEFRISTRDRGWKLCEAMITPLIDENGFVKKIIVVARDITDKRKAEELLWKYDKLMAVGELAAGFAHEIRNPVTTIKGFFQLFQKGMMKPDYFDLIITEFNHIEDIINEFITLAKPQAIEMETVKVEHLLNGVKTLLEPEANLKNVQIYQEYEVTSHEILCNPNQLKQVFMNLLKNSIESMPNGGNIHINVSLEACHVLIKIIDNGIGISEERIQFLGEPFYSNKEKGTGLGLTVCYKILREHNGTISFKSKKNKGTTVEIKLPFSFNKQ